jgi:penicillin-binding protein 1A
MLQPGSGFKPFMYATALKAGVINMDSILSNAPLTVVDGDGNEKTFKNASKNENHSTYSLRTALASSINLPALHTIQEIGPEAVVQTAYENFGFKSTLAPYLPLALGASAVHPIEIAEGYSVFMLHGDRVQPQPVFRVTDSAGDLVKQYQPQRISGAFDPAVSDEVDELLRGVVENGTGSAANVVPNARGKTGTTNDAKDAWFTGYADGVLGVGWVGHEYKDKKTGIWNIGIMDQAVYGGNTSAKIWAAVMKVACAKYGKAIPAPAINERPKRKPKELDPGADVDPDLMGTSNDKGSGVDPATVAVAPGSDPPKPPKPAVDKTSPPKTDEDTKPIVITGDDTDQPTPPKAEKPKRPVKKDAESDTVTLDICQDSGLIANMYCPETVTRTFKRGKEPKRICHIHGPGG